MQGATATYSIANMCTGPVQGTGYFDPGSIHTANMTGLTPSTRYYYIYGSDVSHPVSCPHAGSWQFSHQSVLPGIANAAAIYCSDCAQPNQGH